MDASTGEEPPPDSTDVAGWKRVVADGLLDRFPLEAIVAALQDLRLNTDLGLRNALGEEPQRQGLPAASAAGGPQSPERRLRHHRPGARPGFRGARPTPLSRCEGPPPSFRSARPVPAQRRDRQGSARAPDSGRDHGQTAQEAAPADPPGGDGQEVEFDDANRQSDVAEAAGPPDGDDAPPAKARWNPALLDGVRATDQQIDTDRFLAENIKDDQKRLAFRLYMDDVPFKSKKHHSIAKALGIDEKTARLWIEEIKAQLKEKIGDLT